MIDKKQVVIMPENLPLSVLEFVCETEDEKIFLANVWDVMRERIGKQQTIRKILSLTDDHTRKECHQ